MKWENDQYGILWRVIFNNSFPELFTVASVRNDMEELELYFHKIGMQWLLVTVVLF